MADLSKITLPSGTTYNLKDAQARADIAAIESAIAGGVSFLGITTTALTDGATTNPITIGGQSVSAINGCIVIYDTKEFIWVDADTSWHLLGSADEFGLLAFKDSASGSYTPAGTVSQPTFTGSSTTSTGSFTPEGSVAAPTISVATAGSTTTIKNPTKVTVAKTVVAAAPGATAPSNSLTYYAVAGETLSLYQLGYTTGDSITTSDVTVKTGDAAYEATAPTFTGTAGSVSVSGTPSGTVSQPTFSGTAATITVS